MVRTGSPARTRIAQALVGAISLWLAMIVVPSASRAGNPTIIVNDTSYRPADVTVTVGDVFWFTSGTLTHTVTADDGSFDSGDLAPGKTFDRFFDRTGVVTYHCKIHGFTGRLTIVAAGTSVGPTAAPTVTPTPIPVAPTPAPATAVPSGAPASTATVSPVPTGDAATTPTTGGDAASLSPIAVVGIVVGIVLVVLLLLFVIPAPRRRGGGPG